jgi:hypothetical protein
MPKKTYAENVSQAEVMIAGIRANQERFAKRGLGNDFPVDMEINLKDVRNFNNEQESIKAKLKTKTEELNTSMEALEGKIDEAKKVVKLEFDKSEWKQFGIDDKR